MYDSEMIFVGWLAGTMLFKLLLITSAGSGVALHRLTPTSLRPQTFNARASVALGNPGGDAGATEVLTLLSKAVATRGISLLMLM